MQKVNILGTEYEIIREAFEDETIDGFCDYTAHAFLYDDGFGFCGRTERDSKAN